MFKNHMQPPSSPLRHLTLLQVILRLLGIEQTTILHAVRVNACRHQVLAGGLALHNSDVTSPLYIDCKLY